MSLKSPLGKVLGSGSAMEGAQHWWGQRLTALALVPLTLWFAFSLLGLQGLGNHGIIYAWIAEPWTGILLILLLISLLYHSQLGLQVVVEDYVRGWISVATLIALKFIHIVLAVAGIYSVVRISVGVYL